MCSLTYKCCLATVRNAVDCSPVSGGFTGQEVLNLHPAYPPTSGPCLTAETRNNSFPNLEGQRRHVCKYQNGFFAFL